MTDKFYSTKQIVAAYIKNNFEKKATAIFLEVPYNWLCKKMENDEDLKEAIESAQEMRLDVAETKLDFLVNVGYFPAIKFLLDRKGRKRGYGEKIEIDDKSKKQFTGFKIIDGEKIAELV